MDQPALAGRVNVAAVGAASEGPLTVEQLAVVELQAAEEEVEPAAAAAAAEAAAAPAPPEAAAAAAAPPGVDASGAPGLTGVETTAPPVPVVHWSGPCLSQAGGKGAVWANRFTPVGENVGLLQLAILMDWTSAPGILAIWSKLACTRLIGIGE